MPAWRRYNWYDNQSLCVNETYIHYFFFHKVLILIYIYKGSCFQEVVVLSEQKYFLVTDEFKIKEIFNNCFVNVTIDKDYTSIMALMTIVHNKTVLHSQSQTTKKNF